MFAQNTFVCRPGPNAAEVFEASNRGIKVGQMKRGQRDIVGRMLVCIIIIIMKGERGR